MSILRLHAAFVACIRMAIVHILCYRYHSGREIALYKAGRRIFTLASNSRVMDSVDIKSTTVIDEDYPLSSSTGPPPSTISHILPIFNRNIVHITVDHPYGALVQSKSAAVSELLHLLTTINTTTIDNSSNGGMQHGDSMDIKHQQLRVEYLIKYLESVFVPIQTIPFLNFALVGDWRKIHSNLATPHASPNMRCEMFQTIQCKDNEYTCEHGVIIDKVVWRYDEYGPAATDPGGSSDTLQDTRYDKIESHGTLSVHSKYGINSRGELDLSLQEHVLHAEVLPKDLDRFFVDLQRTVPFDSFDPNDTCHKIIVSAGHGTTYVPTIIT